MTHRNTQQDTENLEECHPLPCFPCPLHPPILLWLLCPPAVAVSLEGATEHNCNSRLIALRKQVRPHKTEDRSGVTTSETVPTVGQQSRPCQESRTAQGQQDGTRVLSHRFWSSQEGIPAWEQNWLTEPNEIMIKSNILISGAGGEVGKDTTKLLTSREWAHQIPQEKPKLLVWKISTVGNAVSDPSTFHLLPGPWCINRAYTAHCLGTAKWWSIHRGPGYTRAQSATGLRLFTPFSHCCTACWALCPLQEGYISEWGAQDWFGEKKDNNQHFCSVWTHFFMALCKH